MKVLGVNTFFYLTENDFFHEINFGSKFSFSGYDIVLLDLNNFTQNYLSNEYTSKDNNYHKREIINDFMYVKNEIELFLEKGKNIYIFCSGYIENKHVFKNLKIDPLCFIPIKIKLQKEQSNHHEITGNSLFLSLLQNISPVLDGVFSLHSSYENKTPLMTFHNDSRCVSMHTPYKKGNIVFLPALSFPPNTVYVNNEELKNSLVSIFIEFEKMLSLDVDGKNIPEWVHSLSTPAEKNIQDKILKLTSANNKILEKIEFENSILKDLKKLKFLFTASGKAFENIVQEIFKLLGFTFQDTISNRTDIICGYRDKYCVFEIKGLTKSAAEKNAVQLEKWVGEFFEKNEILPKPILLVNTFKDLPLHQRTEASFPHQMLDYATKRNHCLITGIQLLGMYLDIEKHPEKKDEILDDFLNTVGVYDKYLNYEEFLIISEENN